MIAIASNSRAARWSRPYRTREILPASERSDPHLLVLIRKIRTVCACEFADGAAECASLRWGAVNVAGQSERVGPALRTLDAVGLRTETRELLSQEVHSTQTTDADVRPLLRRLGARGLLSFGWPPPFGRGGGFAATAAVADELAQLGFPDTLFILTVQVAAQVLLRAGSPKQKADLLPRIASGEICITILLTEAEAGSDLAGLTTTAEPVADGWVLNGSKRYNLQTARADYGLCLARTERRPSKYEGLTLFLVPLTTAGVSITSLRSIADEPFHEVSLDNVRVAADAVVGTIGAAWPLVVSALQFERTGVDYNARAHRWLSALSDNLRQHGPREIGVDAVGRFSARLAASRALTTATIQQIDKEIDDERLPSAAKWYASELAQEIAWKALELTETQSAEEPNATELERAYCEAPGLTISGGASEVLLGIVGVDSDELLKGELNDPVEEQLRLALRRKLVAPKRGTPEDDWAALLNIRALAFDTPLTHGGYGLGLVASTVVAEEVASSTVASRFVDTTAVVDTFVMGRSSDARDTLDALTLGRLGIALGGLRPRVAAARQKTGWKIDGEISGVRWPRAAEHLVVPVRADDRAALVLVPLRGNGCRVRERRAVDGQSLAHVSLAAVVVPESAVIATLPCDDPEWDRLEGRVFIRQAALLCGLARAAQSEAGRRVRSREQFGVKLIEFQSVFLRLAAVAAEIAAARCLVRAAARGVDMGDCPQWIPRCAVALATEIALRSTRLAVQLHGAFGMTAASVVHDLYRRAAAEATRFGAPQGVWADIGRARLREPHTESWP